MNKHSKGKALENAVSKTNMRYRVNGDALILYKGTSVNITKNTVLLQKGPPDFEGLLKGGTYICFDAKETADKTSLPLVNLAEHQVNHLKLTSELGGVGFFLVHFYKLYETKAYKIPIDFILPYWDAWKYDGGRASIPVKDLKEEWLVDIDNYLGLK